MTYQEIFDRVCEHLADQGQPALDNQGECRYRNDKGQMCAIGCLLDDSEYDPKMEGELVRVLFDKFPHISKKFTGININFLRELQEIHDKMVDVSVLKDELKYLSRRYALDNSKIDLIIKWEIL